MIETIKRVICDVTGRSLGEKAPNDQPTGWAVVRRHDGLEVAHFSDLRHLMLYGTKLYEACMLQIGSRAVVDDPFAGEGQQ